MLVLVLMLATVAYASQLPVVKVVDATGTERSSFGASDSVFLDLSYLYNISAVQIVVKDQQNRPVYMMALSKVDSPSLRIPIPSPPSEGAYRVAVTLRGANFEMTVEKSFAYGGPALWPWTLLLIAVISLAGATAYVLRLRGRESPCIQRLYHFLELPHGVSIPITGDSIVVGRRLLLTYGVPKDVAQYISQNHAKIYKVNDVWYVQDLGSTNGTWLNGKNIKGLGPQPLEEGSVITLAKLLNIRFYSSVVCT